jgi:hypothetical protein
MKYLFSFTRVSGNSKTGPIPTTVTNSASCPSACPFDKSGCYAQTGMVAMHWRKLDKVASGAVSAGAKGYGTPLDQSQLVGAIQALPKGQLWRHNVAGDLPHTEQTIQGDFLQEITKANQGKKGFTYTHHEVINNKVNRQLIKQANDYGFTINLSANDIGHADKLQALNIGPVVCVIADEWKQGDKKTIQTTAGNTIVICPAVTDDNMTCDKCGVCAIATRKSIIGFPVHGIGKRKAANIAKGNRVISIKAIK